MVQTIHVVSHTHWDREWYRPFQVFRARLVDLVDALLDLLETTPEYRAFHLDGQTALLEDYLEIRPEQAPRLQRLIAEGRVLIGPWYTQPDEFLVSGEALVRNLLRGRRVALAYGGCMDLGYLPDMFGHTGQMPQILAGFGFPAAILFRGITVDQVPSAFVWRGVDGTALLTLKLPDDTAYSNFFYGLQTTLAAEGPIDWDAAGRQLAQLREESEAVAVCEHLLWMDGVDHVWANPKIPALIEYANRTLDGAQVVHSTLPGFVEAVRAAAPDLTEQVGELRHANRAWRLQALLANVASSHIRLKQANHDVQILLERIAEPLSSMAWLHGGAYPRAFLDLAWKTLLQNHAHDSICGCSVDQVHRDMRYRFDQIALVGGIVRDRALNVLAAATDTAFVAPGDTAFIVCNPSAYARTGTVLVDVPLGAEPAGSLRVYDSAGHAVERQVLGVTARSPLTQKRFDIPTREERHVHRLALAGVTLPPYGVVAFGAGAAPGPRRPQGSLFAAPHAMENTFLYAAIERDGTLTLVHKPTGRIYRGLLALEDGGDCGDGWVWVPPRFDQVVLSRGRPFDLARVHDGPLVAAMRLSLRLFVPRGQEPAPHEADAARVRRADETVALPVEITLSLAAASRRLDVDVWVDNRAQNHRLRLLFPTGVATDDCLAEVAYDVVRRPIALPDSHDWREPQLGTSPHQSFVGVGDARGGLALFTAGTPEYEVVDDPPRTLAITLLRAFGRGAGEPHEYLDSQEPGPHTYRFAVYPFAGSWAEGGVVREARLWAVAPLVREVAAPEVPARGDGGLPTGRSLVSVTGTGIDVTAVKLCESRDTLLLRCVNLSEVRQQAELGAHAVVREAYRVTLAEERLAPLPVAAGGTVRLTLAPREIASVELVVDAGALGH